MIRTEIYCDDCEENTSGIYGEFLFIRDGMDPCRIHLCEKCAAKWNRCAYGQSRYADAQRIREDDLLTQLAAARDRIEELEALLYASAPAAPDPGTFTAT